MTSQARSQRWNRRVLFRCLSVGVAVLILETTCAVAVRLRHGDPNAIFEQRDIIASGDPVNDNLEWELPIVPHPYLGAVLPPTNTAKTDGRSGWKINEYGFPDQESPIHEQSPNELIVGVTGGSVARQMVMECGVMMEELLRKDIKDSRKTSVRVVPMAADGYKQPQQFFTAAYFMTLGAHFDVLINLDGLNEIALPAIDNIPAGVAVSFPRNWAMLTAATRSRKLSRIEGYTLYLQKKKADWAAFFSRRPMRWSSTATLAWCVLRNDFNAKVLEQIDLARNAIREGVAFGSLGPLQTFATEGESFAYSADIWSNSSILMNQLCESRGIQYFHFLQPNQYVPDSKPMGKSERQVSQTDGSPFRLPVENHYHRLQSRGAELKKAGVRFINLTQVFADVQDELYRDDCCHVNKRGSELLVKAICKVVAASSALE